MASIALAETPRKNLEETARDAGMKMRDKLQDEMRSAREKRAPYLLFEPENHQEILAETMEMFEK
ncbi:uncharacterized protein RHO25_002414 [Cercospora beticola]|uniref:Uncharacterized protein n=1 Tax=Cercospora beticola TaxID=122368 RepID=A0ABZ0NE49_CERBT|nr:hypothetical protein RHO25_002414 [Cercospora beticola]